MMMCLYREPTIALCGGLLSLAIDVGIDFTTFAIHRTVSILVIVGGSRSPLVADGEACARCPRQHSLLGQSRRRRC